MQREGGRRRGAARRRRQHLVSRAKFEGRPWRAAASAERAAYMEAVTRGERVATTTGDESAVVRRDAVRATRSGGRGGEEVAEELRGCAEAAAARLDGRGGAVARVTETRHGGARSCGFRRRQ
ncbi:hypothetical protein VPH35_059540 [Triticum aestivum]